MRPRPRLSFRFCPSFVFVFGFRTAAPRGTTIRNRSEGEGAGWGGVWERENVPGAWRIDASLAGGPRRRLASFDRLGRVVSVGLWDCGVVELWLVVRVLRNITLMCDKRLLR